VASTTTKSYVPVNPSATMVSPSVEVGEPPALDPLPQPSAQPPPSAPLPVSYDTVGAVSPRSRWNRSASPSSTATTSPGTGTTHPNSAAVPVYPTRYDTSTSSPAAANTISAWSDSARSPSTCTSPAHAHAAGDSTDHVANIVPPTVPAAA
jgi:hypothetical protein